MKDIEPLPLASESPQGTPQASNEAPQGGPEDEAPDLPGMLDARMSELPDNQKAFVAQYLAAPETSALFGLILGNEALDYFMKYADPSVTLQVVPKQGSSTPQGGGQAPSPAPQGGLMASPGQAPAPKAGPIMGPM